MTSISKEYVEMGMLPYKIYDLRKEGYVHFRIDIISKDPKMVQLRAWKDVPVVKNFKCRECGQKFNNPVTLRSHQIAKNHLAKIP